MIFSKCMIGRQPQITYHGYVLPCCWVEYTENIKYDTNKLDKNMFLNENFNLYKNKLVDILNSDEWSVMLNKINIQKPITCIKKCSNYMLNENKEPTPENSTNLKINPNFNHKMNIINSLSTDEQKFLNNYVHPANIDMIQLETTSRCSLQCLSCQRKYKTKYFKDDLKPDIIKDIFFTKNWYKVIDCGRFGDTVYYKYLDELLDILLDSSIQFYEFNLAATGRGEKWWSNFLQRLQKIKYSGTEIIINFGIDGLRDTNSIYRVNQNFDEIFNAMLYAKDLGLLVKWQFIPFSHNEHQLPKIKAIAHELGIELKLVLSSRFNSHKDKLLPTNNSLHNYK